MKRFLSLLLAMLMVLSMATIAYAEPVEIEIWSPLTGAKAATLDSLVADFNASQTEYVANVIHQGGYDVVRQKMAGAANTTTMPPMVVADYIDVPLYVQRNVLLPMTDVLSEEVVADFFPGMMVDLTVDGVVYAVPYNRTTQGFIVNNDLLKQAGITRVASTWDEFYEDAVAFKKAMGEDYYYSYAYFNQYIFEAIAMSFDCTITTADGTAMMTEDKMVNLFKFFRKMYEEDLLAMVPTTSGGFSDQHSTFLEGKVATVFQSSSFVPSAQTLLDCDWSFEYVPAGEGGHSVTIGGTNLAVTTAATEAEKAGCKAFIEYVTSPENCAKVFIETSNLPVRQSVLELDSVKTFMAENEFTTNLLNQMQYGKNASGVTKNVGSVFSSVSDMIVRLIYNGEDIEETLEEYNELFQDEFDEKKQNGSYIY